jgi:CelD/BcsL family acetyltransferase involved in cellulose biosynthesis
MTLELRVEEGGEHLTSLRGEWSDLLGRSTQDEPMLAPEWVLPWCREYGTVLGRRIHVAEVRREGRLVALAPFVSRRRRHRTVLPLRRLELACTGEPEADEVSSEYVGVVVERGFESDVAALLAREVAARRFGLVDELRIPAMNSEDPMTIALGDAFRREGWTTELTAWSDAPYSPLPATWDAFLSHLPGRRRHTVRRAERDLESWAEGPPRLHVAADDASLDEGRRILEALHGDRWRAVGRSGAFASSAFLRFHAEAMPALLSSGALELLWLEAKGEPLAILYNIVWRNKVYHYQSGRRMDLPRPLRPGLAAHAQAIRRSIELGRREYDFLAGDHRYKRELSLQTRRLVALDAFRPGLLHSARRLVDRAADALRNLPVLKRRGLAEGPGRKAVRDEE